MSNQQDNMPSGDKQPKKSLNFYWIYALIGAVLLAMLVFNNSGSVAKMTYNEFKEVANEGKVEKFVENAGRARIYLKKETPKDSTQKTFFPAMGKAPDYEFNIPPGENVRDEIRQLSEDHKFAYTYEPVNELGQQIMMWLLVIGIMIVVWIVLMRRLGGGSAGGGQIFNIG